MSLDDFDLGKIIKHCSRFRRFFGMPLAVYIYRLRGAEDLQWFTPMCYQRQISVTTEGHGDMHDLTEQLASIISSSGIQTGTVNIFNVGSTAAIGTIEFEPGLQHDLPAILDKLIPPSRSYGHEQTWHDGSGHSHSQATLLGPSLTVPVSAGKLVLGTWQQIFHLECDVRGRERTIVVTVIGD
jgi:secondary thiamine-phosphate synthase enzyme